MTHVKKSIRHVRSRYRSPWYGVVLHEHKRRYKGKRCASLCYVLITHDKNGHRMTRRYIKVLSDWWLRDAQPLDITWVNPDWLKKCKKIEESA